jgi:hypothetical protein
MLNVYIRYLTGTAEGQRFTFLVHDKGNVRPLLLEYDHIFLRQITSKPTQRRSVPNKLHYHSLRYGPRLVLAVEGNESCVFDAHTLEAFATHEHVIASTSIVRFLLKMLLLIKVWTMVFEFSTVHVDFG